MTYLSKVIPLVRARSSIISPATTALRSRTAPLRSVSSIIPSGSNYNDSNTSMAGSSRGYATAFAGLRCGECFVTAVNATGSKMQLTRSMSDVAVPEPPTSNHIHKDLPGATGKLIYTETDEAPALATFSLLPVLAKFGALAEVDVVPCDISVAGRVLATFPEKLKSHQRVPDNLAHLGDLCKTPDAVVVKLPNVSASIPQLDACIAELRSKGYDVPLYPHEPKDDEEKSIQARYATVLGSAVNPVLREGNSDRRVAAPVKAYAQKNPHKMGIWSKASRTHVAHMDKGDFFSSEQSTTVKDATDVQIEHVAPDGTVTVLKESTKLEAGEVIDASTMSVEDLCEFYEREISDAKENDILLSLHLKATMMKISDPILFGHCVKVFFKDVFAKHGALFEEIGANPNNGLGAVLESIDSKLPADKAAEIRADIDAAYEERPWLAMVNSDKGITNLHVPSDIIIDASMPVVIRDSGQMWNKDNELEDTKCLIPDRSYATMYQEVISYCKTHGQFDVATMGNVANVGLMAQKAEEYGSHDKTFEIPAQGVVMVRDKNSNEVYFEHAVKQGDLWRMAQTKDEPIKDWVRLAVERAKATGSRTIFWLDKRRAHDASLINKVNEYLKDHDTSGVDISIMKPVDAIRISMERCTAGKDTISVTGNVLRDYLTDLFPILELGTSAKMLSIVPLLSGGGLFETGAGGSAPKHVQQFVEEGHLRWDSLGEYLATAVAFEHLGNISKNDKALLLAKALDKAVGRILDNRKSPSRRVKEIDNRATNFYVALYWAEYLAAEDAAFQPIFEKLSANRSKIVVTSMSYLFSDMRIFNEDISEWDVSSVRDMRYMFKDASAFNGDLSAWNVSSVTNMNYMFTDARAFNGDLSAWNVSSVTDMRYMFYDASVFNGDLSPWDISSVKNMKGVFGYASAFNSDLSQWNVSSVTDMKSMFNYASAFNGDLSAWNVSSVTDMGFMFWDASTFNGDLSAWDISSVTNMEWMFRYASAFNGDLSAWNVTSVADMEYMFWGASAFNQDLCAWNDKFPYNHSHAIFSESGCTFQYDPNEQQGGPFCASSCNE